MNVLVTVDAEAAIRTLHGDADQIPYAMSRALNDVALEVQKAERANIHRVFTVRRPAWVDRSVKITFAKKSSLSTTIGIHPPGGDKRADILGKFETDTQKLPRGRTIAVPVSTRIKRGNTGIIAKRDRPAAYNFRQQGKRLIGDRRTFIIKRADGTGTIFQRTGRGKASTIFALYVLRRRVRLTPDLHFIPIAVDVINRTFEGAMVRRFDEAIRTAGTTKQSPLEEALALGAQIA